MYLALFLAPWVLMYSASTFVMNHRDWFRGKPPTPSPPLEKVRELTWDGEFAPNATPKQKAEQLLVALGLDGSHQIPRNSPDGTLVINRMDARHPTRITYRAEDKHITVEQRRFESVGFLEHMHRRRGYQHGYFTDTAWAVSVDLFIVVVIFWALSGLWMWWELKVTRKLGLLAALAGIGLFALFLETL